MILERVISGGQTGADRGGLAAAKAAGIPTGGWMPRGFLALDGLRPEFAGLYGVREHSSHRYPPRTERNVKESAGTLRFATDWDSPGEVLTLRVCEKHGKPHRAVTPGDGTTAAVVAAWITANRIRVLNVAGNTERTSPGIEAFVAGFLAEVFRVLRDGPARPVPRRKHLAAELAAALGRCRPDDEPARGAAMLTWLVGCVAEGEPVLVSYGAAWDLLRPRVSRRHRGVGVYRPMLVAASRLTPQAVPELGPVTLDTFIVNATKKEPGVGLWDDVAYSRTVWRRVFAGAVVIRPGDLR